MKTIFSLIIVFFWITDVSAQRISDLPQNRAARAAQPAQPVQPAQPAVPETIVFDKLVHDYGTIRRGSDGNSVFTFTNKGNKPLILNNVAAACGCTVPEWPREPIPPGGKGEIKVKYDTNLNGTFNKSITVHSNASNQVVRLSVKGQVVAP
ncbi:MAG: DUF1573 domain-containing protein [Bacteroidota bacterium]